MNIYIYIYLKIFWWRGGMENDKFSINKIEKRLDVTFISIKNMKWKFDNFLVLGKGPS